MPASAAFSCNISGFSWESSRIRSCGQRFCKKQRRSPGKSESVKSILLGRGRALAARQRLHRDTGRGGPGLNIELLKDVVEMDLHGFLAHIQDGGHVRVSFALGNP